MQATANEPDINRRIHDLHIHGSVSPSGIFNFLNIPYATFPGRFRQAVYLDPRSNDGVVDGTRYGHPCYQPPDEPRVMRKHLYAGVESADRTSSPAEFSCLNLNVYTPVAAEEPDNPCSKLPVLVYIHGGSWVLGDGNSDYDGNYLVRHSVDIGRPFIFVAINYRLGYYGWLSSQELQNEAQAHGESVWTNQGLYDQRLAFLWVKQNIHFFGGDGDNVTLAGESAGAWSVFAHLVGDVPVCKHAFIMSYPSWPIPSTKAAQDDFHRVVEKIGLCQRSPAAQKMNRLRDLSPAEMQDMIQGGITWPQWDPEWFSQYGKQLLDEFQFAPWVERVVIGHTRDENALLSMFLPLKSTTEVIECVRKLVPEKTFADAILDAYHISSEIEVSQALKSFCQLATDSEFGVAPYTVSDTQTCPVHLYRFDQTDDFESSPFRGHAYHALDNVFFCRLPAVAGPGAPESAGATSDALSSALAKTIYGSEPWPEYKQSGKLMVFDGPNSGVIMQENPKRWENLVETEEQRLMFASIMPTLYSTML